MADDEKRRLEIPWITLLPMVAALAGIIVQYKPLVSARPAAPGGKPVEVAADQDADARLWQDPLGVAQKEKAALDADLQVKKVSERRVQRHSLAALSERIKKAVDETGTGGVLLLPVMLESGPYLEQAESRLRGRRAVLEGLSESGFIPTDGEHIGFVSEQPWPPSEKNTTDNGANEKDGAASEKENPMVAQATDSSLLLAWEQCQRADNEVTAVRNRSGLENSFKRVFVLWLPAASFNPRPLGNLAMLIAKLAPYNRPQLAVRMIGPANSTGLKAMLHETEDWNQPDQYNKALVGVSIFSARATASDDFLLGDSTPKGRSLENVIKERVMKSIGGDFDFRRTILTDDKVLRALIEELPLHRIDVVPWRNWRGRWRPADHIVILSEWDSAYGRALAKTFQTEAQAARPREAPFGPQIHPYRYMHGIDGHLPGDSPKEDARNSSKTQSASSNPVEATEGLNQSDFLRRLARRLKQDERRWLRQDQSGVRAIGILGSDIYDKLMILRALRPAFPKAVFFTNNYDAHFERLDDWDDVHNLIIASPFGGTLSREKQEALAPFRDNDQTSMYAGTRMALGTITDMGEVVRQPHLFEIGRKGARELLKPADPASTLRSNEVEVRWFWQWLSHRRVYLSLVMSGVALFLMAGWITLSMADRRLAGGGGLRDRVKRLGASTPFWLICGTPFIILSITLLAQCGTAVLEPFAFFSGISIWPSEMLRLIALMLTVHFMMKARVDLEANERELTTRFGLTLLPQRKWNWREMHIGLRRWQKEHPDWVKPDATFTAKEAWSAYLLRNQSWPRFIRVTALFVIYMAFSVGVFVLFGLPVTPARGKFAFIVDVCVLIPAVVGLMMLTFYVVDAIRLNSNFIRIVAGGVTKWEADVSVGGSRIPPLTREELARYYDIAFVAARTEVVAPLIWYPLIVLAVMVVARSSFFDNWTWPPSLILVFTLNALWAFGSAAFLRRAAEQLRAAAIGSLQSLRVSSYKNRMRTRMFDDLISEIRSLKKGAFAPLSEQPFIRAVILPSGGLGLLAVAQHLLDIF
jgi:hypothetical protein